jgi:hypothetical protein
MILCKTASCPRVACAWSEVGFAEYCCRNCAESNGHHPRCHEGNANALRLEKERKIGRNLGQGYSSALPTAPGT